MNKKGKAWLIVLLIFLLIDIISHFVIHTDGNMFGIHLNYIASILMAFTVGLCVAETPKFKD